MKWQIHHFLLHIEKVGIHGIAVCLMLFVFYFFHLNKFNSLIFCFVLTANLAGGLRTSETSIEDMFIRKFITGTFSRMVLSEIIIKRQFNHIRIAAIVRRALPPRKFYFLIGYTEELLANWLQCPVTLELQTTQSEKDVIFKYI